MLRPVAGWRGFADEIIIVVVGVFLALVAQQWVEDRALARRLSFTEQALALEIAPSLYAAHERIALDPCLKSQLVGLHKRLVANGDAWAARPMFAVKPGIDEVEVAYGSVTRLWPTASWETATGSEALAAMPDERLNDYAKAFSMIALIRQLQTKELELAPRIAHLAQNGSLDPAMRAQALTNVSALYQNRYLILLSSQQLLRIIDQLDLAIAPQREQSMNAELAEVRQAFGACAAPYRIRLTSTVD